MAKLSLASRLVQLTFFPFPMPIHSINILAILLSNFLFTFFGQEDNDDDDEYNIRNIQHIDCPSVRACLSVCVRSGQFVMRIHLAIQQYPARMHPNICPVLLLISVKVFFGIVSGNIDNDNNNVYRAWEINRKRPTR